MKKVLLSVLLFAMTVVAQDQVDVTPHVYGYFRTYYITDLYSGQGQFQLKEARIGVKGNVNDVFSYRILFDMARYTTITTTSIIYKDTAGKVQNKTVVTGTSNSFTDGLCDAEAIFTPVKSFSVIMGQSVIPFGYENQKGNSDIEFVNRALLYNNVTPELRDMGGMATYSVKMPVPVEVKAGLYNGSGQNKAENDKATNYTALAMVRPLADLSVSASYYGGRIAFNKVNIVDVSADFKLGQLQVCGEYSSRKSDFAATTATAAYNATGTGFYAYGLYDFNYTNCILTHIIPAIRYEGYDPSTSVTGDNISRTTFGVALQFAKINFARIRINYELFSNKDNSAVASGVTKKAGVDIDNKFIFEFLARF
jgi:hypothetical protein